MNLWEFIIGLIKNFRNLMALVFIGTFVLWLATVCFFLLPIIMSQPEGLDPMMGLVAGLGIGGVTQFFIVMGTLIFQFYFRRAQEGEKPL